MLLSDQDRHVIETLTMKLMRARPDTVWTKDIQNTEDQNGYWFEINVADADGMPTGRIARVQVTLDRVESDDQQQGH